MVIIIGRTWTWSSPHYCYEMGLSLCSGSAIEPLLGDHSGAMLIVDPTCVHCTEDSSTTTLVNWTLPHYTDATETPQAATFQAYCPTERRVNACLSIQRTARDEQSFNIVHSFLLPEHACHRISSPDDITVCGSHIRALLYATPQL